MAHFIFSLNKKRLFPIIIILYMCLWFLSETFALGVDEKLSLRILNVSETKKTILINRGIEDGLVSGDHAKFFLTDGVFARGVLIELSPARSVWALYRIADENQIVPDKMVNLKITPKVKLTDDPTKMLSGSDSAVASAGDNKEEIVLDESNSISDSAKEEIVEGVDDEEKEFVAREISSESMKKGAEIKEELGGEDKEETSITPKSSLTQRTWEVWGTLHLNALNSKNSTGIDASGTKGEVKTIDMMLGVEKYFSSYKKWYGSFSLYPFLHLYKQEATSIEGHEVSNDILGYGAGLNWHFLAPPLSVGQMIGFAGGNYGIGNAKDVTIVRFGGESEKIPLAGKASFFSVGGGIKYYIHKGFGLKALLDYYYRGEVYSIAGKNDPYTKKVKGPRILLGLSYRW